MKKLNNNSLYLISPWFWAACISLFSCLMILSVDEKYQSYIHEPIFKKYNILSILFVLAAGTVFFYSSQLSYRIDQKYRSPIFRSDTSRIWPVFLTLLVNLFYSSFLVSSVGVSNVIDLLIGDGGSGNAFKLQLSEAISGSRLGWINDFSLALISWCIICYSRKNRLVLTCLILSAILFAFNSLVSVSRDSLVSLLMISFIIYLAKLYRSRKLNLLKVSRLVIVSAIGFIVIFPA